MIAEALKNGRNHHYVVGLMAAAAFAAAEAPAQATAQRAVSSREVGLDTGQTIGKDGGMLWGYEQAAGVECDPRLLTLNKPRKPLYTNVGNILLDATFSRVTDFNPREMDNPTVYVGRNDSYPYGGYYPLKQGWAVRFEPRDRTYDVYHFNVKPHKSRKSYDGGTYFEGKAYGREIGSYSMMDLQLYGAPGISFVDGETKINMAVAPTMALNYSLEPLINISVSCAYDMNIPSPDTTASGDARV